MKQLFSETVPHIYRVPLEDEVQQRHSLLQEGVHELAAKLWSIKQDFNWFNKCFSAVKSYSTCSSLTLMHALITGLESNACKEKLD